jgi:soluble lytic murein transglycosylase
MRKRLHSALTAVFAVCGAVVGALAAWPAAAQAQTRPALRADGSAARAELAADELFLAARDAARLNDRDRLAALGARLVDHPLAAYIELWQLVPRLRTEEPAAADALATAFIARHEGSFIADRMRMEWLLALGARGDFDTLLREQPRQVWTHDEQQVRCYAMLARYARNESRQIEQLARDARALLAATREAGGDGCLALTEALLDDDRVSAWERMRALVEQNQFASARRLAARIPRADPAQVAQAIDRPAAWLATHERRLTQVQRELAMVAIARLARDDPEQAARFAGALHLHFTPEQRGIVWGRVGHMGALKLLPEALDWYRRGGEGVGVGLDAVRSDEVLEWQVRAALRGTRQGPDWSMVRATIERMPTELARDAAWTYWRGRALAALGQPADAQEAWRAVLALPTSRFSFYGKLAAEELGVPIVLPPRPVPPAPELVATFHNNPGLLRALKFYELGLRAEGHREWNWQTRGMSDRQLLALAEFARNRGVLDRMISTSDRTREEFDFAQRFPSPHRDLLVRHAQAVGLDETWVYGLIRQESRFIADARSSAGAQGLMQLMPATARYVARRVGMTDYAPARITDLDVNLRLGTSYLRFVLDDLDGHPVLASAAYNAGPSRPRQWRASLPRAVEGAIFAETIPFNETRDYVKKVMSNSVYYAALFDNKAQSLKARLGQVAPKTAGSTELP